MSFFTLGKEGENVVILTDAVEQCAGLTKVRLTREEAEELTRLLNFMLQVRPEAPAFVPYNLAPKRDTERAPPLPPEAPVDDVIAEAMAGDKAIIEARRARDEAKREARRVVLLGEKAEEFMGGDE